MVELNLSRNKKSFALSGVGRSCRKILEIVNGDLAKVQVANNMRSLYYRGGM